MHYTNQPCIVTTCNRITRNADMQNLLHANKAYPDYDTANQISSVNLCTSVLMLLQRLVTDYIPENGFCCGLSTSNTKTNNCTSSVISRSIYMQQKLMFYKKRKISKMCIEVLNRWLKKKEVFNSMNNNKRQTTKHQTLHRNRLPSSIISSRFNWTIKFKTNLFPDVSYLCSTFESIFVQNWIKFVNAATDVL